MVYQPRKPGEVFGGNIQITAGNTTGQIIINTVSDAVDGSSVKATE